MRDEAIEIRSLTLLVTICDRAKSKKITDLFTAKNASFNLLALGKGTANSKMLNYLGIGETEKAVHFSIMATSEAAEALAKLDERLDLKKPGHGIAFTLPMESAYIDESTRFTFEKFEKKEGGGMKKERRHDLIFAVVNRGYTQDVMDAARAGGATGGTIIHARGFALEGAEKFFGLTIQPEKEIVLILARSDRRDAIMHNIVTKTGVMTPAGAVTFSLPASGVEGLQEALPEAERL